MLSLQACGYKADPYYEYAAPKADKNVKFILQKREFEKNENNESCE